MVSMMRCGQWGGLVAIALALGGCGKQAVKPADDRPAWLTNPPQEAGRLYGVGSAEVFARQDADALKRAKERALVDVLGQIEVTTRGSTTVGTHVREDGGSAQILREVDEQIRSRIPEFKVRTARLVDSYRDERNPRIYTLMELDTAKEAALLEEEIGALDSELAQYQERANETSGEGFAVVQPLIPALVRIERRETLKRSLNRLRREPDTPGLTPGQEVLREAILDQLAALRVGIAPSGQGDPALRTALVAALADNGFKVDKEGWDLLIRYDLRDTQSQREDVYFVRTEGNVEIVDGAGRTINAFVARTKGSSVDPDVARSRAIAQLADRLGKALGESLFVGSGGRDVAGGER